MYSPADLPSSTRAAPAKKRMLSVATGISSLAYESGLPTFSDSSSAISSACSSSASASLSSISARSPGVVSIHSTRAFFAAWTAWSTSSADARGTSAITSPVDGLRTSIVSPLEASTHSPPMRFWCMETVVLTITSSSFVSKDARFTCQALRNCHRDDGGQQDQEDDDVHFGQLLADADVAEDPDRKSGIGPSRKCRDDHLVERERKGEQCPRNKGCRQRWKGDVPEGLKAVGAEIHRSLGQRGRCAPKPRDHVVVNDHHAEGGMAHDDGPEAKVELPEAEERVQRHPGDDPREREGQNEQERD